MIDDSEFQDEPDEDCVESLDSRVAEIEEALANSGDTGGAFLYFFGATLAMILSWSRNASILYCIGHGLISWVYVIYFAYSRR